MALAAGVSQCQGVGRNDLAVSVRSQDGRCSTIYLENVGLYIALAAPRLGRTRDQRSNGSRLRSLGHVAVDAGKISHTAAGNRTI